MSDKPKRYTSDAIDVTFDANRCIHAAECVRGLPAVFDVHERPWIRPDLAAADAIAAVVERCPSGALHFERKDGGPTESTPKQNTIQLRANGPLYVRGVVRIDKPDGAIVAEDVRVALCRCGQSKNKPFCDNAHKEAGFVDDGSLQGDGGSSAEPGALAITLRVDGPLKVQGPFSLVSADGANVHHGTDTALCRCGGSGNKPFCDGTHKRIGFQA